MKWIRAKSITEGTLAKFKVARLQSLALAVDEEQLLASRCMPTPTCMSATGRGSIGSASTRLAGQSLCTA